MPRMSEQMKREWTYFRSGISGRRKYNTLCRRCVNACKQSFRAVVVECGRYESKRKKRND